MLDEAVDRLDVSRAETAAFVTDLLDSLAGLSRDAGLTHSAALIHAAIGVVRLEANAQSIGAVSGQAART